MNERLKGVLADTKKVFSTRWSASELNVPAWVINSIIYITILRSLSYGLELFITYLSNPISPLMAFANILGIQTWGILMILGVVILLAGLMLRNSITITIGALLCAAVWTAFGLILGLGAIDIGTGWRFVIAALATAATWVLFFYIQLRTIRLNGVLS